MHDPADRAADAVTSVGSKPEEARKGDGRTFRHARSAGRPDAATRRDRPGPSFRLPPYQTRCHSRGRRFAPRPRASLLISAREIKHREHGPPPDASFLRDG